MVYQRQLHFNSTCLVLFLFDSCFSMLLRLVWFIQDNIELYSIHPMSTRKYQETNGEVGGSCRVARIIILYWYLLSFYPNSLIAFVLLLLWNHPAADGMEFLLLRFATDHQSYWEITDPHNRLSVTLVVVPLFLNRMDKSYIIRELLPLALDCPRAASSLWLLALLNTTEGKTRPKLVSGRCRAIKIETLKA